MIGVGDGNMLDLERQVYVIFGLGGMIGNAFYKKIIDLTSDYRIYAFDHARVDICNKSHVAPLVEYIKPTIIINCAAVSDPEICESAIAGAHSVNSMGPMSLAEEAKKHGAKLVHMSHYTVFDGKKTTPYTERASTKPLSILGKTKDEGERRIRSAHGNHLIIRPGWLFGEDGECLVKEWIAQADRNLRLTVNDGQVVSPVFADDLATAVLGLIEADSQGTFHIANSGTATIEDIAKAVVDLCKLKDTISPVACDSNLPQSSTLSCKKYKSACHKQMRPWPDALKECLYRMGRYQP